MIVNYLIAFLKMADESTGIVLDYNFASSLLQCKKSIFNDNRAMASSLLNWMDHSQNVTKIDEICIFLELVSKASNEHNMDKILINRRFGNRMK